MEIEFDPVKDKENRAKHGIGLAAAAVIFNGPYVEDVDDRFDYGEERLIAYGMIGDRVYVCVYTERGEGRRIISLRQAEKGEANEFYKAIGR